jgi:hypothetical protein
MANPKSCPKAEAARKYAWATSYENDTDDLQSRHGGVYQALVKLSEDIENVLDNFDYSVSGSTFVTACKSVVNTIAGTPPNSFKDMMITVFTQLKSGKPVQWNSGSDPYPANLPYNKNYAMDPHPISNDCHQDTVNFFAYTLNKIPKLDSENGGKPYGVLLEKVTIDNDMQTDLLALSDFHVVRLAQLALFKTVFQIIIIAVQAEMSSMTNIDTASPVIQSAHKCIHILENLVSTTLDYATDPSSSPDSFTDLERLYFNIKSLSNNNSATAHMVTETQRKIDLRRDVLQTALNANISIDRVIWWSKFQKWMWILLMIAVTITSILAVLSHKLILLYIEGAVVLFIILFIFMMNWLHFTISGPYMSDITASIRQAFYIPWALF